MKELCLNSNGIVLQVLDFELQRQLVPYMKDMVPLPGIYDQDFIAANQVRPPAAKSRLQRSLLNTQGIGHLHS